MRYRTLPHGGEKIGVIGMGSSAENLHSSVSDSANWLDRTRFSGGASESDIKEWVNVLALTGVGE